jgi:hypothetical protein
MCQPHMLLVWKELMYSLTCLRNGPCLGEFSLQRDDMQNDGQEKKLEYCMFLIKSANNLNHAKVTVIDRS